MSRQYHGRCELEEQPVVQERNGFADLCVVVFGAALLLAFIIAVTGLAASMGV